MVIREFCAYAMMTMEKYIHVIADINWIFVLFYTSYRVAAGGYNAD